MKHTNPVKHIKSIACILIAVIFAVSSVCALQTTQVSAASKPAQVKSLTVKLGRQGPHRQDPHHLEWVRMMWLLMQNPTDLPKLPDLLETLDMLDLPDRMKLRQINKQNHN